MILGAVDVGSNGVRLAVAKVTGAGNVRVIENHREAVRLGAEVFESGRISPKTIGRVVRTVARFQERLQACGASRVRGVATSAVREARNRELLLDRVREEAGIALQVIGGEEEARLVFLAVSQKVSLSARLAMLVDLGGGSVEVSIGENGVLASSASFKMGAVRLLHILQGKGVDTARFHTRAAEYADGIRRHVRRAAGDRRIDLCVATGGNVESLVDLRKTLLRRPGDAPLRTDELGAIVAKLESMTVFERVKRLRLRPDRADVIVPAGIVLHAILVQAGVSEVVVPRVGLKEGVLADLASEMLGTGLLRRRDQVLASVRRLGRHCAHDEDHAWTVARHAATLFDSLQNLHRLQEDCRVLLEAAAVLHDVGQFVDMTGHHKHSYYLIRNSPLVGLTLEEREIVANVARYHRKSPPKATHLPFALLSPKDRNVVERLASMLRLADACDVEHGSRVQALEARRQGRKVVLRVGASTDLLLEEWALAKKGRLFERVFDVDLGIRRIAPGTWKARGARKPRGGRSRR